MSLRYKTLLILSFSWILILCLLYLAAEAYLKKGFEALEVEYAQRNVVRLVNVIHEEIKQVSRHNQDITKLNSVKNIFLGQANTFSPKSLLHSEVGLYSFWNTDKQLLSGHYYSFLMERFLPFPNELKRSVFEYQLLGDKGHASGVVRLSNGFWLISSQPVYDNDSKTLLGYSLLGKHLTDNELSALSSIAMLSFQLYDYKKAVELEYLTVPIAHLKQTPSPYIEPVNSKVTHGFAFLRDVQDKPVALIKTEISRDILSTGIRTTHYFYLILVAIAAIISLVIWFLLKIFVIDRLSSLSKQVTSYEAVNDPDFRVYITGSDELTHMSIAINKMLRMISSAKGELESRVKSRTQELLDTNKRLRDEIQMRTDVESELRNKEVMLEHMAHHDALTGAPNRVYFNEQLQKAIHIAEKGQKKLAVLFVDLDRFKFINDALGHDFGDHVLQDVSKRITGVLREGDLMARLGGDEFIIYATNVNSKDDIEKVAKRILNAVKDPVKVKGREFHISMSIGISMFPEDGNSIESLESFADVAMYRAKAEGGNQYQFYTKTLQDASKRKLELETMLRNALDNNELTLHYQPILSTKSKRLVMVEALCRWQHPTLGMIPPAEFIPIAEETGLIYRIGEWVLEQACQQQKSWVDAGYAAIIMAVNVSALQYLEPVFVDKVKHILEKTQIVPECLELELTESTLMECTTTSQDKLMQLKALGVKVSLDDFGTGYSSMSYLRNFPIDTLKIDRSFIVDSTSSHRDKALVGAIVELGQKLGLNVLAEGIETYSELSYFLLEGCDMLQGFLFSKPLPAERVCEYLPMIEDSSQQVSTLWPSAPATDDIIIMRGNGVHRSSDQQQR